MMHSTLTGRVHQSDSGDRVSTGPDARVNAIPESKIMDSSSKHTVSFHCVDSCKIAGWDAVLEGVVPSESLIPPGPVD